MCNIFLNFLSVLVWIKVAYRLGFAANHRWLGSLILNLLCLLGGWAVLVLDSWWIQLRLINCFLHLRVDLLFLSVWMMSQVNLFVVVMVHMMHWLFVVRMCIVLKFLILELLAFEFLFQGLHLKGLTLNFLVHPCKLFNRLPAEWQVLNPLHVSLVNFEGIPLLTFSQSVFMCASMSSEHTVNSESRLWLAQASSSEGHSFVPRIVLVPEFGVPGNWISDPNVAMNHWLDFLVPLWGNSLILLYHCPDFDLLDTFLNDFSFFESINIFLIRVFLQLFDMIYILLFIFLDDFVLLYSDVKQN